MIYSALKTFQCKIHSLGNRAVSCEDWQEALAACTRLGNSLPSCRALVKRPTGQPAEHQAVSSQGTDLTELS